MSLFNALNTGITGLGTNGLSMSVIGDNISNLNTVGYKGSTAEFQDLILQQLGGGRGQLGQGAFTGKVGQVFGQGSLENSSLVSDMAVDGKGFFVVQDAEGNRNYTRAGQFRTDEDGYLVTFSGEKLQGYGTTADGALGTTLTDLTIPSDPVPGEATTGISIRANLAPGDGTDVVPAALTSWDDVTNAASFTTSTTVYDSLGRPQDVTVAFYETAAGTWSFEAYVDGGTTTTGVADVPEVVASGTLTFDGNGDLVPASSTSTGSPITFTGASAQTMVFDFGIDAAGGDVGSMTQQGLTSSVSEIDPDGVASGNLSYWDMSPDGTITGIYSNGTTQTLGQVVLANFRAESNLTRVGHNLWSATRESGEPVVGEPGAGGRGVVHGYALEMSNVDLENQFVKMIQSQKGYQASARVVSSVDDLLQELMQMV
jgi:flagellar hook protein FlgE